MVRQQTWTGLQIKFHFYGRSDWGRNRGYGEGAAKDDGRWKNGDETFASLGSTQEYGGWTRPLWNNGDEVFTCCGPARVGGDPACHPQIKCPTHN